MRAVCHHCSGLSLSHHSGVSLGVALYMFAEEAGPGGGEAEADLKSGGTGEEGAQARVCDREPSAGSPGQPPEREGLGARSRWLGGPAGRNGGGVP